MENHFVWDDREKSSFTPCEYCEALNEFPADEHGNSTACTHCDYYIILYCLSHNTEE